MVHIEVALWPSVVDSSAHLPGRIGMETIEVGVDVRHRPFLETKEERKNRYGVGDALNAQFVCLSEDARLHQVHQLLGVYIRNDHIGGESLAVFSHHARSFLAFHQDSAHFVTGQDGAAILLKHLTQSLHDGIATAHDAKSAFVVEIEDESMGGKGCLVLLGCIERKVAHQHLTQQGVGDGLIDDLA